MPPLDACLWSQCLACLHASRSISARLIVNPFFSYCTDADGGSYDVINDASSPAAGECCAQQSSARHNWEMNYQEAAIYLQVSPAVWCIVWKMNFWNYGSSWWQETKSFSFEVKKSVLCKGIHSKSGEMLEVPSDGLWQVIWEQLNKLPILSHLSQCQGL